MPSKYRMIADQLRINIETGLYEGRATLPTEHALMREFQVSRQTIRQALALLEVDGFIKKRQGSGSHILPHTAAPVHRRTIAIVTTYITDYIFPSILREAENVLSANGCTPSLFATQNKISNERRILKTLLEMNIDGLLIEGTKSALPNPNLDLYQQLLDKGIPLIFIHGNYSNFPGTHFVLNDNFGGGKMLVEHLYAKGYRNIAGIFKNDDIQGHQRYAGYAAALRDFCLTVEDDHVFWYDTDQKECILSDEGRLAAVEYTLKGCDAVVCYNDEIALQLVRFLLKKRVRIPEDLAIVSFDNSRLSEMSPVPITSLSHDNYNIGKIAAEKLVSLLRGDPCQSEFVPWTLVERTSG